MADKPEQTAGVSLPDRRARLEALKAKRQENTEGAAPAPAAAAPAAPMGGRGPQARGAAAGGGRRKMMVKLYKVMTGKPGDNSGFVAGTPFTNDGVTRLMDMLRQRSKDDSVAGSKMAKSALNFLTPGEGETEGPGGSSLERVKGIAQQVEKLRAGRGGRNN